ncbi:MAG TPA: right-handed parallel beta-helix repeat-containing protein [Thermoanaerobaculia bacterium]
MRHAIFALLIASLLSTASVSATNYYVALPANGGSNSNNGTSLSTPFATIQKGVDMMVPGDTLYVRAGTYNELVTIWNKAGTSSLPLYILPYNSETVVIDGANLTAQTAVVGIGRSSYVRFDGFEVKNGIEAGVKIYAASNVKVRWNNIHDNQTFGIHILSPESWGQSHDILLEGNTVRRNVLNNSDRDESSGWAQAIGTWQVVDIDILKNYVHENFGEGIDCLLSDGCRIVENTVYDNFSVNVYLDNATDTLVNRNFIASGRISNASDYYRNGHGAAGISMANEDYVIQNPLNGLTITNNIVVGGSHSFSYSNSEHGGGLHNTLIANNTFYGGSAGQMFYIQTPSPDVHDTTTIRNNIFYAKTGQAYAYATSSNITYGYNNWYNGTTNTHKSGSGDVLANPLLVSAGTTTKTDYKLTSTSPCINAGTTHTAVTTDYWGTTRGTVHDIGAHEY